MGLSNQQLKFYCGIDLHARENGFRFKMPANCSAVPARTAIFPPKLLRMISCTSISSADGVRLEATMIWPLWNQNPLQNPEMRRYHAGLLTYL
jgi:hypothetical protein